MGTSTNVNKSGIAALAEGDDNSKLEDDLDFDKEFDYNSDEDSIFIEPEQDVGISFPRPGARISINKENKSNSK